MADGNGHSGLAPLHTANLRAQTKQAIRTGIITGDIVSGEIYSARRLAEDLGVSATPVREALLDLSNDGLVEPLRNVGFQVVDLSEQDLDEILELRLLVEVPGTGQAARRLSAETLVELRGLADAMQQNAVNGEVDEFLERDRVFHLTILEAAGNQRMSALVSRLRDQARLQGIGGLAAAGRLGTTAAEHQNIVDALESRNRKAVESVMRTHLKHTRGIWAGRDEPLGAGDSPADDS